MKTCRLCLKSKEKSEFYAHEGMRDRLRGECKSCTRRVALARYYEEVKRRKGKA